MGQRRRRIGDGPAVNARVQIDLWPSDLKFQRYYATEAITQSRCSRCDHAGIGYNHHIAFELRLPRLQERRKIATADFFLTLNHEVEIYWQLATSLHRFLHSQYVGQNLAFVVRRATREHVAVLQHGLKWR